MSLDQRIEDFMLIIRNCEDKWQINGTYHSIKATLLDYKKYDQPYNARKVNKLLPKMEIKYREWQNKIEKIEKNNEQKRRNYSSTKILIKELKTQNKKEKN